MRFNFKQALFASGAAVLALGTANVAFAADLDPEPEKEYVEVGSFRGSILLPGTGISFKVGGYTKGDVIFTFEDFAPGSGQGAGELLFFPGIFNGTGGDRVRFHALQSRINFDARTTTDLGSARAFLELDLFNTAGNEIASNSANPRLRHAFAELGIESLGGSLLVGQTWTNFGDLATYANTLDFNGPNGQVFARQAQIRWTQPISESLTFSVAAENPEFAGPASGGDNGLDSVPDFTLALKASTGFGNFHFGAVLRYLDVDNGANPGPGFSTDTAFGWGIQGAAVINVGEKNKIRAQFNYGQGIGRYLQAGPTAALQDAVTGELDTVTAFGGIISYQHFWSDQLQSNLVFGYAHIDDIGGVDATGAATGLTSTNELDSDIYAAINLIYSPRSNINLGIEGLYGRLETSTAGVSTDVDGFRLQTSLQFSF